MYEAEQQFVSPERSFVNSQVAPVGLFFLSPERHKCACMHPIRFVESSCKRLFLSCVEANVTSSQVSELTREQLISRKVRLLLAKFAKFWPWTTLTPVGWLWMDPQKVFYQVGNLQMP